MDSTVSVSKGVFLFKNGYDKSKKSKKKSKASHISSIFSQEPWYISFKSNWKSMESQINDLNTKTYSILLNDMVKYVKSFYSDDETTMMEGVVPSATLLTGVNQPDHVSQFTALIQKLRDEVTPHIAMVPSQDAPSVKHLVENVVYQFIKDGDNVDIIDSEDLNESFQQTKKLRKNQCTMSTLQKWYRMKNATTAKSSPSKKKKHTPSKKSLIVIIPDFESFNCSVLQDFVLIMSAYVPALPIIFIFGVATSVSALHKSFPYHVSSKLLIKVFHTHSSPVYMNQVLEDIFLTHNSPFHLSGKAFELLIDVFLFYDFSVTGLIQSIKYCMMEHYYDDNTKSLCCPREDLEQAVINLSAQDLEAIRQLPSFRPYLESQDCRTKIRMFEDNAFLKEMLLKQLNRLHDYLNSFYLCLRLLTVFVKDLPRNPLGKSVREIYTKCATQNITETATFKECMQFLTFQSQVKLMECLKSAIKIINDNLQCFSPIKPLRSTPTKNNLLKGNTLHLNNDLGEAFIKTVKIHLVTFLRHIQNASTEISTVTSMDLDDSGSFDTENTPGNRYKLKEQLLRATRVEKVQSEFEMVRSRLLSYLEEVFGKGLSPLQAQPFHEVLLFSEAAAVRKQIVGSPRGALHTALSNPTHYLQCTCCLLITAESLAASLPDLSVAYKLHRECGRHVNLYDWLQAFAGLMQPKCDDHDHDTRHVDPQLQLRFTRAVSELQFLGFIKTSKRKTDHVMRLTW